MSKISAYFLCLILIFTFSITIPGLAYADGQEGGEQPMRDQSASGGTENVPPHKTWDKAWSGYFGRDLPDPLADPNMTPDEWNKKREDAARHGQAAADFTAAATTVVSAGAPSPTLGVTAAQMAVSEGAGAVVEAETTPPPAKPGVLRRFWNWVKSWFD